MVAQVNKPIARLVELPIETIVEPPRRYSPEEYLAIEVDSAERHEFRNGEIILMAGALPNHNRITLNIGGFLNFASRGKPYQVFAADQRLWIPAHQIYTYPDVTVIQGDLALKEGRRDTLLNPVLIVEVLSDSTAAYDRGDKFEAYRSIPEFQEYLLVSQSSQRIEHYVKRSPKKWDFQAYDETDMMVQLETIGVELAIVDIYDKVEFEVGV